MRAAEKKQSSKVQIKSLNFDYKILLAKQRTLKNVTNYLNAKIYSYSETSGDQSSHLYLNVVHFSNTSVN